MALREGTLEMHGRPSLRSWTRLGATANNGSSSITLLEPVDWPLNSLVVIATTNDRFSQKESELRRVTNISSNGLILTLDTPLIYTHLGITRRINSTSVDLRAEVGLLSHNVIFQGLSSEMQGDTIIGVSSGSVTATWDETIEACPDGFNPGLTELLRLASLRHI